MKRTLIPCTAKTNIIGTDGSTLIVDFPYAKLDLFINPDLKSNSLWLPESDVKLTEIDQKSSKYKAYEFSFESLVDSNSNEE